MKIIVKAEIKKLENITKTIKKKLIKKEKKKQLVNVVL